MAQYRNSKTISWLALVIAIAALTLAWMSYTQSPTTQETVSDEMDGNIIEMRADLQATEEELLGSDNTTTTEDVDQETEVAE